MRAKDPSEFLTIYNSSPIGDPIFGTTHSVAWRIEPRVTGFTTFFLVKVGPRIATRLSMKAAQRERPVLVETFAPTLPA
jgi:hypothetical protein